MHIVSPSAVLDSMVNRRNGLALAGVIIRYTGLICIPANLALSFARRGIRTGLLDTDIFGPSIPTLLNLSGEPRLDESEPTPNPLT